MKKSYCLVPSLLLLCLALAACGGGGSGAPPPPGASSLPPTATTQAAISVTTSGAVLNGSVNPNGMATDVWFEYGLNPLLVGATQSPRQTIGSGVAAVSVNYTASGFTTGTTYYFRVCASSTAGTSLGTILNCTTGSPGSAPTVTTIAASGIGTDNARISGSVNPNGQAANAWFEWGTSGTLTNYFPTSTQSAGSGSSAVILNATLTGLSSGTPYYYRVAATNGTGTSRGSILSFTTSLPSLPPIATTLGATNIGVDNATVNGHVNPNGLATTAYFEWGLDNQLVGATATSGQSIGSGNSNVAVNVALTGLTDNTTYYYRVVGTNSAGTSRGIIGSFTTKVNGVPPPGNTVRIIFLHHSTGGVIWDGGIPQALASYNASHATQYSITNQTYPDAPYPWENYPYDYWNLWVAHTGASMDQNQANLDMLTRDYDVVVFKHCFPVSAIDPDVGPASVSSSTKSLQNYYLQYGALKARLRGFPNKRFIVWTGAALRIEDTTLENATRAKTFFDWVRNTWDEKGDNVFVWDFYALETEGTLYLTPANADTDSHPNKAFGQRVAPLFVNRLVDVIEGRGDTGSITGN